ncbi:MAG: hypothetical protein AAF928_03160 [Myxococcota bacterium]
MHRRRSSRLVSLALGLAALAAAGCDPIQDAIYAVHPPSISLTSKPPISGGTLHVTADDRYVVMADPNLDRLTAWRTADHEVAADVAWPRGAEPGRIADGAASRVHVVLRGLGAIASVDIADGSVVERSVCPEPRGLAHHADAGTLVVACVGGDVVTLAEDPSDTEPRARWFVEPDLRDALVVDGEVFVTTFRHPALLRLDDEGRIVERAQPTLDQGSLGDSVPTVAWRTRALPWGRVAMLHQMSLDTELRQPPSGPPVYYGSGERCGASVVQPAVTLFERKPGGDLEVIGGVRINGMGGAYDIAADGRRLVVSGAGRVELDLATFSSTIAVCRDNNDLGASAVAFDQYGRLYTQMYRGLYRTGPEPDDDARVATWWPAENTGHDLFHGPTAGALISCASCHPEGRDDGHVWRFAAGPRRTHSLLGGTAGTAPYHWEGDIGSFEELMREVYSERMQGRRLAPGEIAAVEHWMTKDLRPLRIAPAAAPEVLSRGRALYEDPVVGCARCHEGEGLTRSFDVNTGGSFQAPVLLGLSLRAPLMHDGCATSIRHRMVDEDCGGGDAHGKTSHLSPEALADLVAYLESL